MRHPIPPTRRPAPRGAALALSMAAALSLAGCAAPGDTTCDEYAALSYEEQSQLERDLLRAHDLEPNSVGNSIGVRQNILSFCGLPGLNMVGGGTETATQNTSSPIEDAVDWESTSW